jgi:hypothetical protein
VAGKVAQPVITTPYEHARDRSFVAKDEWFPEQKIPQADGSILTVLPKPTFTVAEVSKVFFAQDPDWLRWRLKKSAQNPHGFFVLDGKPLPERRTTTSTPGFRYYTLADVEKMAHALCQNGAIAGAELVHIITIVKAMLILYGFIEAPVE